MHGMEQNAELRLPTIAVPIRLAVVGGPLVDAELFVPDKVRTGRTQLLEDLAAALDDESAFVAVRYPNREVRLLAKRAIAWVEALRSANEDVEFDAEAPSEVVMLYDRQHRVEIELLNRSTLFEGSLFDSSAATRPRVIDHLNQARRFLRLWTAQAQTLINTEQIAYVSEQR